MIKDLSNEIFIGYTDEVLLPKALQLSSQLNLTINDKAKKQLLVTPSKLILKIDKFLPIAADFNLSTWQRRLNAGKKQGLVRACKPSVNKYIIDATAGWGRDAAILASFGAKVIMLERNPIMAALLQDALARQDLVSKKSLQLGLYQQDACVYLENLTEKNYPDLIYIDPMHPKREKSSLVKKELQVLQQLLGSKEDPLPLLLTARRKAKVVLKWPAKHSQILPTANQILGKTVRFDIYEKL